MTTDTKDRTAKPRHRDNPPVRTEDTEPELRFSSEPLEIRSTGNKDQVRLVGYPVVFGSRGKVYDGQGKRGYFEEVIAPGATRGLENDRIALTVEHNASAIPLAATWNGTIKWNADARGVHMDATLDDTRSDCHDAAAAVLSGILNKMSFRFVKGPNFRDSWSPDYETRTIHQLGGLRDFSLVQSPAYEDSSVEVAQRSLVRAWRIMDIGETELRSGKVLSKTTVGALTNAVGSILTAGHHIGEAHQHVTNLLTSNGINLDSLPGGLQDGSGGNGAPGPNNGGPGLGNQDGAGSRGRLTPRERDLLELFREQLDDERRENDRQIAEVRRILEEARYW